MATQQQTTIDVLAAPVPAARVENLVVTDVGDDVVVYDEVQHHIHHLNRTSAVVWRLCDGQRGVTDLVRLARPELGSAVDEDVIRLALEELENAELLVRPLRREIPVPTHTRRMVIRRMGKAGLTAALVASVTAATVAEAGASPAPPTCTTKACTSEADCSGKGTNHCGCDGCCGPTKC